MKLQKQRNRKKAELTTEMLIGLIVVVILVVLAILIIYGKVNFFSKNTDCSSQGGSCMVAGDCKGSVLYSASCSSIDGKSAVCCYNQGGSS